LVEGGDNHPGAVLSDRELIRLCGDDKPLIDPLDQNCLKGAAYDLRVGSDGIVLPDGKTIPPGEGRVDDPILVQPGETVLVTTLERLRMPPDMVGNMSIKGELGKRGVLALTGLIVDPGYGTQGDGRLHFPLANLGDAPVALIPEVTKLASIQFIRLTGDADRIEPKSAFADIWVDEGGPPGRLGFVSDLRDLEERSELLESRLERQARATDYLIAGGVFLLAITLLGLALAAILSLGSDSKIVTAAGSVIPDDRGEQALGVCALFGIAAIALGLSSGVAMRSSPSREAIESRRYPRAEAWRSLRARRGIRRMGFLVGCVALGLVTAGATDELGVNALFSVPAALVVLGLAGWVLYPYLVSPITPQAVDQEIQSWTEEE
jgi:dCTP deaminase